MRIKPAGEAASGSAAMSARKSHSGSGRRICTSPLPPTRRNSASTSRSRSSSGSAPKSCSTWPSVPTRWWPRSTPASAQGARPSATGGEPGAPALLRRAVRSGDLTKRENEMKRINRRRLCSFPAPVLSPRGTGGLAAILASGRAPAYAQGTTLHWVRGSDYVPVSDQTLRTKILEQCQKDLGIKLNVETINGLTIQARVTSAVSVRHRSRHHQCAQQLGAALRRECRRCQRRCRGNRQGAGRFLRNLKGDRL